MRHLTTEELLLYATSELDDRALCRHVRDCVDCKAVLVEVQETFVGAAVAIRASVPTEPFEAQAASLAWLRAHIAAETEKIGCCLTAGELLLSNEAQLSAERAVHLSGCSRCQREAANMRVLLAGVEEELRSLTADEPVKLKAAALAELEKRLTVETKEAVTARKPQTKIIAFPVTRVREYAAVAVAAAAAFVIWFGFQVVQPPELSFDRFMPAAPAIAVSAPEPVESARPGSFPQAVEAVESTRVERFEFAASSAAMPTREAFTGTVPSPLASGSAPETALLPWEAPELRAYRPTETVSETLIATAQSDPIRKDATESVIEGFWLLAGTGLWKQDIRPVGNGENIIFTGSVAEASGMAAIESKLRSAADGRSVTFDLALRDDSLGSAERVMTFEQAANRPAGGMVRNSLLAHYRDAARRSFRSPRISLLEAELERYVSDVLRHDSELLAHVHVVHSVLSRADAAGLGGSSTLNRLIKFHLAGIANREAAIYAKLSEVLPRRYWNYRAKKVVPEGSIEAVDESGELLADALGLDEILTTIFVSGSATLDARDSERSCGERLASIRSHVARLRRAIH